MVSPQTCPLTSDSDAEICTKAILDEHGFFLQKDSFSVNVCLETRKMVKAKLGDRNLSPNDALMLVWLHTIFAGHIKIHALANWAVNLDGPPEADLLHNSLATVIYNYFGFSVFPWLCKLFYFLGWTSTSWPGLKAVFQSGLQEGVHNHKALRELRDYSEVVGFVANIRNYFLNCLAERKASFPGVNGEALFAATVLHSLDHQLMEWNMQDPLWILADSKDFQAMAELGRIARVGFVTDLPGILFNRKLKGSTDPFSEAVYAHAARLDVRFADAIDTCIIK